MKTYTIYLFRHGQTTYNRDEKFTGVSDPLLTSLGHKEAHSVAIKLKNAKFGIAVHTHLKRSKQTLNEVLKFHPECTKIAQDDRMIERDYGTLDGTTHESYIKAHTLRAYNEIHRDYNTRPPKGESFADVEHRVKAFIATLKTKIKQEQTNVAISAHGNSIRLFRKIMERASTKKACSWTIPYDKVYKYKIRV
jgi:2,3-bisphosphoglycerate-dependent phosphoglycerate mutase